MVLVNNKKKSLFSCNGVAFRPGVNEIEGGVLDSLLLHWLFKLEVDEGRLVIEKKHIEDKSEYEALELVKETFTLKVLDKMLKKETRPKVIEAINKQREFFIKPSEK